MSKILFFRKSTKVPPPAAMADEGVLGEQVEEWRPRATPTSSHREHFKKHLRDMADLVLHGISISLSLIIVGVWNSYIFSRLGKHVFAHVPGLHERGSLSFAIITTVVVGLIFYVLVLLMPEGSVEPKKIAAGVGAKPFLPNLEPR